MSSYIVVNDLNILIQENIDKSIKIQNNSDVSTKEFAFSDSFRFLLWRQFT
ncbi:hypothetical protein CWI37_0123p0010 [Hamiltosporidium tvaerminnensis]|uniref:Uncharacterized protein n=2 Tax=Hamiltosporidium TaxID=1176354 RepID=A0A4Q9LL74_9MICR|nr:hypothetical protein CWI37_0123p0010 [Hamiltosporidium tvaerminnensis]TBU09058.1 hypothetical protein CWI39_0111p0020 [Hamiltosporidium magnivora]